MFFREWKRNVLISAAVLTTLIIWLFRSSIGLTTPRGDSSLGIARQISAAELMSRPLATDLGSFPRIFHQSWKSLELPAKFKTWSDSCRAKHPDWEWVLWTDADNLELVRKHFSWLEKTYHDLPGEIYRADLVRNLYMYTFGG